jgi:hypothetical protein
MTAIDYIPERPAALYHYTTRERVEEVQTDLEDPGVYAEASDGVYGPGFYALDLDPRDHDLERLRWECFEHARSTHPMDGVLVLDPGLAESRFVYQERHIWLYPVDPGCDRPPSIGHMLSAVGVLRDDGRWEIIDLE